jgi:D-3-phosphoglycerate dehydrogenase / 2-oxoglutarate reductase
MATEPRDRGCVLVIDPIDPGAERRLARAVELVRPEGLEPRQLRAALEAATGAIVRTTPLPRTVLSGAGALRVIAKHGTGVDGIDLACASERGIVVARAGGANATAVAEFTLAAILLTLKPILSGSRWLRTTTVHGPLVVAAEHAGLVARELSSQIVGIVGFGEIGRRVAAAVSVLGGSVLVYDPPAQAAGLTPEGIEFSGDLQRLLRTADVVTVHVPLTVATRALLGPSELGVMKRTAALVNTSRGGVVDEGALVSALRRGRLRAAVVDVYEHEPPPPSHPLFAADDVICTPHMAGITAEALGRMADGAVAAVLDVLEGREPADVANPDVLPRLGLASARG